MIDTDLLFLTLNLQQRHVDRAVGNIDTAARLPDPFEIECLFEELGRRFGIRHDDRNMT